MIYVSASNYDRIGKIVQLARTSALQAEDQGSIPCPSTYAFKAFTG